MQLFGEDGSFGALALGVDLEEVEVVLPEPVVGSKVRRVVWGKLVVKRASYLDTGYRRKQAWVGRLD